MLYRLKRVLYIGTWGSNKTKEMLYGDDDSSQDSGTEILII